MQRSGHLKTQPDPPEKRTRASWAVVILVRVPRDNAIEEGSAEGALYGDEAVWPHHRIA